MKKHNNILFDALQSEEGGRFYREENRNVILETDLDELRKGIGDNYMILDYEDIISLTKKGGIINVQLRLNGLPDYNKNMKILLKLSNIALNKFIPAITSDCKIKSQE